MLETQGLGESLESVVGIPSTKQPSSNQILGRHFRKPASKSNSYGNAVKSRKGQPTQSSKEKTRTKGCRN